MQLHRVELLNRITWKSNLTKLTRAKSDFEVRFDTDKMA